MGLQAHESKPLTTGFSPGPKHSFSRAASRKK
jgi:hypothetical protein